MSAPQDRERRPRPPLHERSQSQNNRLQIRIVPYSPPRPDRRVSSSSTVTSASNAASSAAQPQHASQPYAPEASGSAPAPALEPAGAPSAAEGGQATSSRRSSSSRTKSHGDEREGGHSTRQGLALSSPSSSAVSLVHRGDEGVSGSKLATGTSGEGPRTPTATPALRSPSYVTNITAVNASTQQGSDDANQLSDSLSTHEQEQEHEQPPNSASSTSSAARQPLSRRRNFVAVHSDKTFSLVPLRPTSISLSTSDYGTGSFKSPPLSFTTTPRTSSSHEGRSSDAFSSDGRPSSPLTSAATIPDRSLSPITPSPSSPGSSTIQLTEDPIASSPWNYRLVGGLRKVPKTPDLKQTKPAVYTAHTTSSETRLPALPEASNSAIEDEAASTHSLLPKASFNSAQTESTTSENTNYKVYGHSSPAQYESTESLPGPPSPSHSNIELLGSSSPAPSIDTRSAGSSDEDQNYILHGDPSPSPQASLVTVSRNPRPTYSQESLVVPPLKPRRQRSFERSAYYRQKSRESLRSRANSIKSIRSIKSISSIISEGSAQTFFAGQAFINIPNVPANTYSPSPSGRLQQQEPSWAASGSSPNSSSTHLAPPRIQMIPSTPHQWSSQLSTVMSESEAGSSPSGSRSVSMASPPGSGRRSSRGWGSSTHSRQMLSISSSLAAEMEQSSHSRSHSRTDSLERPAAAYARGNGGPSMRMVHDQDEHGDGLTDLQQINQRPSRTGLSSFFSSSTSLERINSSASSRANSFSSASIPAWAKLYYGSGERRYLGAPSISTSESGSRAGSIFRGGSPANDHFPLNIYSSRKRAREVQPAGQRPFSDSASMDIAPYQPHEGYQQISRGMKKKTSSIWSPHLRMDRRASRYSIWEPPSVNWSAESGMWGRRNIQVVMFIAGFVFPFGKLQLIFTESYTVSLM